MALLDTIRTIFNRKVDDDEGFIRQGKLAIGQNLKDIGTRLLQTQTPGGLTVSQVPQAFVQKVKSQQISPFQRIAENQQNNQFLRSGADIANQGLKSFINLSTMGLVQPKLGERQTKAGIVGNIAGGVAGFGASPLSRVLNKTDVLTSRIAPKATGLTAKIARGLGSEGLQTLGYAGASTLGSKLGLNQQTNQFSPGNLATDFALGTVLRGVGAGTGKAVKGMYTNPKRIDDETAKEIGKFVESMENGFLKKNTDRSQTAKKMIDHKILKDIDRVFTEFFGKPTKDMDFSAKVRALDRELQLTHIPNLMGITDQKAKGLGGEGVAERIKKNQETVDFLKSTLKTEKDKTSRAITKGQIFRIGQDIENLKKLSPSTPEVKGLGGEGVKRYFDNTKKVFVEVKDAKPVSIEGLDTFVHRGLDGKGWQVTENKSGSLMSDGSFKTQQQAIDNATKRLKAYVGAGNDINAKVKELQGFAEASQHPASYSSVDEYNRLNFKANNPSPPTIKTKPIAESKPVSKIKEQVLPWEEPEYVAKYGQPSYQAKADTLKQQAEQLKTKPQAIVPPQTVDEVQKIEKLAPKKVNLLDYFRTPDRVLEKIGLKKESDLLRTQYNSYLDELPVEIGKVTDWYNQVKNIPNSSQNIFRYLDGQKVNLSQPELKVANEMKSYLAEWADKLDLPYDKRIASYVTHIFEKDFIQKDFDEDLAKIIADKIPGSVYDPFLQKRLGKQGYVEDVFRAMDAYVKRAVRKYNMDPALEQLRNKSNSLPLESWKYVKSYTDRINLRPTEIDTMIDNLVKDVVGYKYGARPVTSMSKKLRQQVYRGTLGLNVGSAMKNLTQGVNTYAKLGEKYTGIGYMKNLQDLFSGSDELKRVGVLRDTVIQDRKLSAVKGLLEKADSVLFSLFNAAERINRGSAYFGAKAKFLDQGLSEKDAIQKAVDLVRDTQFTFGSVDSPVALQSDLAKTLLQFQSFNIKQSEFLSEMIKNKEWGGLMRWIGANVAVVAAIGKLMNYDFKDVIPFSGIATGESKLGETPPIRAAKDIYGAAINAPDKYGNISKDPTMVRIIDAIGKNAPAFIPAGTQAKKTIEGLKAFEQGESTTKSGRTRFKIEPTLENQIKSAIFGQWSLPGAKEYIDKLQGKGPEGNIFERFAGKPKTASAEDMIKIPNNIEDLSTVYKSDKSVIDGYQEKKIKIVYDQSLTQDEKDERLTKLQGEMNAAIDRIKIIEDEKPEAIFKIGLDTYASGGGMTVEDRTVWVAEQLANATDKDRETMINQLLESKVLTKSVAEALNAMGVKVDKYTEGGKIKSLGGSGKKAKSVTIKKVTVPTVKVTSTKSNIPSAPKIAALPDIKFTNRKIILPSPSTGKTQTIKIAALPKMKVAKGGFLTG